ncbi:MAG: phage virion morphogenesis protein [Planctomycetota bacterium]
MASSASTRRPPRPVNLRETGDLLDSLHYQRGQKEGTGEVNVAASQARKGEALHRGDRGRGLPARPWMGLTRKDAKEIGGDLGKRSTRIIRRHSGDAYEVEGKGYEGTDADILVVENP